MNYVACIDKYGDIDGIISQEEVDFFDAIEREWKKTLPNDNFNALVKMFPEAKECLKDEIVRCQDFLKKNEVIRKECADLILRKSPTKDEWFWEMIAEELIIDVKKEERVRKIIKRNQTLLNPVKSNKALTDEMIRRAREYPIEELLEFTRLVARCPFHNEKTPSLHLYRNDNHCHCFGCGKSFDSIAIYQHLNNCDFKAAVIALQ